MKVLAVHYKNKYPGSKVTISDSSLDVYDADGEHRVALRRAGSGQVICQSKEQGALDCHDLSPIPKLARVYKLDKSGAIVEDDQAAARKAARSQFMAKGKVLSCEELEAKGYVFDEKQNVVTAPAAAKKTLPADDSTFEREVV